MAHQPHAACKAAQPLVEATKRPKHIAACTQGTLAHGLWKAGGLLARSKIHSSSFSVHLLKKPTSAVVAEHSTSRRPRGQLLLSTFEPSGFRFAQPAPAVALFSSEESLLFEELAARF